MPSSAALAQIAVPVEEAPGQLRIVASPEAVPAPAGADAGAPSEAGPAPGGPDAGARPAVAPAATPPRLEIRSYSLPAALTLERELGVSHVLAQILVRRGIDTPARARAFLAAGETHDPSGFAGIDRAVALIRGHAQRRGRIVVHGDYDVDGVCATAIMIRALRSLGAEVAWFVPGRLEDGYGLSADTVERLAARGTTLIVTVDCGITAFDEVAAARAAGIDVVVCDHHAPRADGRLPDCSVVHPAVCGYPCPDLCGAGAALKLAQALGAPTAAEDLDLVALATVADLVPLTGENRRLVREGLRALATTAKPGLRALMAVARADPSALDTGTLGFRLAPRINAAGRLRRADAGIELLLCEDPERARAIAAELDAVNLERRAVEQRIQWEAEAQVAQLGERSAYVLAARDWHPGVVGIVASRIVERHHRPAILISLDGDPATGSGRSIPGFDLLGALHACAGHLRRYGGHRAAAGLTVDSAAIEQLRDAFERHAAEVLTPELLSPAERVDAVVSGGELGLALAEELEALEPCGMGNPAPRLLIPGARFADIQPMGEGRHARFSVSSGGARARAVAFGCEGRVVDDPAQPVDATFRLERNVWNGAVEPRLVLRQARGCAPAPIRVLRDRRAYLDAVWAELDVALEESTNGVEADGAGGGLREKLCPEVRKARRPPGAPAGHHMQRRVIDRRGDSPLAVLVDAVATSEPVLAVCAQLGRRLGGLRTRVGGFTLTDYARLRTQPSQAGGFSQLVALDPPVSAEDAALLQAGDGFVQLAWGDPELRFTEQMHELEYGLRTSLVALYRGLRARQRVAGEELERLLRGDGPHGRSASLAGRLLRVLTELELVSLDRDLPALAIASRAPTALEHSPSFRVYRQRYEDGRRYLSSANHRAGG